MGLNGLCHTFHCANLGLHICDGDIGGIKALGLGGELRLHIRQEGLHLPSFFFENLHLLGAPGEVFHQLGHLLVEVSLGSGRGSQLVSKILPLGGRVSSKGIQGSTMLVFKFLGTLAYESLQIVVLGTESGFQLLVEGDLLLSSV